MEPHVRRVCHLDVHPVLAERPQPQLPRQQHGRAALQGEQEGVREEGQGLCGAELVRRLTTKDPLVSQRERQYCFDEGSMSEGRKNGRRRNVNFTHSQRIIAMKPGTMKYFF